MIFERKRCEIDTPTSGGGGILASSKVACYRRSYTRSTSVLLPVTPHGEGIKLTPDIFKLGFRQETIREKIN